MRSASKRLVLLARKCLQVVPDFVMHTAEQRQSLLLGSSGRGRVLEGMMEPVRMARIDRAAFLRVVAKVSR